MKKKVPEICYIRKDDHVLVFDGTGHHMQEFEGQWTEKEREIREAAPGITIVDWRKKNETVSHKSE